MPSHTLTVEQYRDAVDAFDRLGNKSAAARDLGIGRQTIRDRIKRGRDLGYHLSEGARGAVQSARLSPQEAHSGWIVDVDPETGSRKSTYWQKPPEAQLDDVLERIRDTMEGIRPAPTIKAPEYADADLLTLYPLSDLHFGLLAWGKETGEDYDTAKASERVRSWVAQCVDASPASETGLILVAGDLLHADDQTNQTPGSKHQLDTDGRHFRTLDVTIEALACAIECAAAKHKRIIVRIIPGNHDKTAYMAILFGLANRYKDSPQISIPKVPGEWFARQHGKVMLAAHHGDKAKPERMVHFLADQYAELWGKTRHRFLFTGHFHHAKMQDIGGVTHEQLRAVTARDAYAVAHGFTARAQLQAITFHRILGEVSRVKINGH